MTLVHAMGCYTNLDITVGVFIGMSVRQQTGHQLIMDASQVQLSNEKTQMFLLPIVNYTHQMNLMLTPVSRYTPRSVGTFRHFMAGFSFNVQFADGVALF